MPENTDKQLIDQAKFEAENLRKVRHNYVLETVGEDFVFDGKLHGEPFVCIVTEYCNVKISKQYLFKDSNLIRNSVFFRTKICSSLLTTIKGVACQYRKRKFSNGSFSSHQPWPSCIRKI